MPSKELVSLDGQLLMGWRNAEALLQIQGREKKEDKPEKEWSGLSESNRHLNLGKSARNGVPTTYEALSGALSSI
jgi:hypothetical protein